MRDIVSALGAQFIISHNLPGLVTRGASTIPGELGPVIFVLDPSQNLAGAIFEGLDYEAIYILESSIFGAGDFGRLTFTVNGTWLSRAELQTLPDTKRFGIAGEFLLQASGSPLTSSLPWNRANASLYYDGPADTWLAGFDIGAIVHWVGQYNDDNIDLTASTKPQDPAAGPLANRARKVADWTTLDLIVSYTFNMPAPAVAEVPGYAKDGGKNVRMKDGKAKNGLPGS